MPLEGFFHNCFAIFNVSSIVKYMYVYILFQKAWDSLLVEIDRGLQVSQATQQLEEGGPGPCEVELWDARQDRPTTLSQYLGKGHTLVIVLLRHFA